jgi:hypothetical protein
MRLNKILKLVFVLFFVQFILQNIVGQNDRIKIAFVCQTDSVFALLKSEEHKSLARYRSEYHFTDSKVFNIDIRESWIAYFRKNLDSTIYEIHNVSMPTEIKDNYFLATYKYTNGFWQASPKLIEWFRQLHKKGQYDIVIILNKPRLDFRYSEVYELNNYSSYGLIHDKNWIYSLNSLLVYDSYGGKIIAQTRLKGYNDYIRVLKGADLSKKKYVEINQSDINIAIDEIIKINNDIGNQVLKKIIKFSNKSPVQPDLTY